MLNRAGQHVPYAPPDLPPLFTDRLPDRLAARLGGQIDAGALRPGDHLPTERRLAAAHGVHFSSLLEFPEQYTKEAMRVTRRNDATRADFVDAVRIEHAAIVDAIAAGDAALARRRAVQHMRGGDRRTRTAAPLDTPRRLDR